MKKRSYKSHEHKVKNFFYFFHLLILCSKVPGPLAFFHVTLPLFQWIQNQRQMRHLLVNMQIKFVWQIFGGSYQHILQALCLLEFNFASISGVQTLFCFKKGQNPGTLMCTPPPLPSQDSFLNVLKMVSKSLIHMQPLFSADHSGELNPL